MGDRSRGALAALLVVTAVFFVGASFSAAWLHLPRTMVVAAIVSGYALWQAARIWGART